MNKINIFCLSHLTWNRKLFQRPQQFMSILTKKHHIDFFCQIPTKQYLKSKNKRDKGFMTLKIDENISVHYFPYLPGTDKSHIQSLLNRKIYTRMVSRYIKQFNPSEYILWLYHPKDIDIINFTKPSVIVYDCMDDFKEFLGESSSLICMEFELLKKADIVFTGGAHLYETKKGLFKEGYFLPCGVDYDHFSKTCQNKPDNIKDLHGLIAGYFGAIDERLNLELLMYITEKLPYINFVFIGPILKINYTELFQKPNVKYIGEVDYSELPNYGSYFDICLIPFDINDLTKTMNPTKTLEYFAMGKPVLSTPLPDIINLFGDNVHIGKSKEEFAEILSKFKDMENPDKIIFRKNLAKTNSWESKVDFIEEKIESILMRKKEKL
jgi:glycosyltransferase involved in cell wall biosynthesis